jgi:lactate permease
MTSPARIELAFKLGEPYQRQDTPGPPLSRGAILRVAMPYVLVCLVAWGMGCLLLLPTTG